MVKRGEIWLAVLEPTVGSEIQKTRPCVIVSPPEMHDHLRTVMAAPMTSKGRPAAFRIALSFDGVSGLILLDQCRALDKQRLVKRLGSVSPEVLSRTLTTLRDLYAV